MRQNTNKIHIFDDQRKEMMGIIQSFYMDTRGEEIGIIGQQQVLDLFMEHLAPIVYNKALDDAQKWYKQMQDNMDSDFYSLYKNID